MQRTVNVSQIITLDRQLLVERIKALPAQSMARVNEGAVGPRCMTLNHAFLRTAGRGYPAS